MKIGHLALACLAMSTLVSCSSSAEEPIPERICGTPVDADLVRPLLEPLGKIDEYNEVDRKTAKTAPCLILVDEKATLRFRFSWHGGAVDPVKKATSIDSVITLNDPARADIGYNAAVGSDGAIATTACRTSGGDHFTLSLLLPRAPKNDKDTRTAIEAFMRAYMRETVKTLGCAKA
ncbi:hypothetical protein GCM10020367_47850 [Streptomyces sannanensis]|uniref:DUF3558 domain-containing protein n=1 Tax=Streptomyces sannanensis TaxID=285536 RepID=A0ABP6SHB1_9ACTN